MGLHLAANIRSEIHGSHREIKEDMKQYVKQLIGGMQVGEGDSGFGRGLDGSDTETSVALGKFNHARKEKEREMQQLIDRWAMGSRNAKI
jgi:hypothetical protein